MLADRNPNENEANGLGLQLIDEEHHLPEEGQVWRIEGLDYKSAFAKAWGLE